MYVVYQSLSRFDGVLLSKELRPDTLRNEGLRAGGGDLSEKPPCSGNMLKKPVELAPANSPCWKVFSVLRGLIYVQD